MTLKKTRLWALIAACIATPALAQNVAVVNGTPIPKAQADVLAAQIGVANSAQLPPPLRTRALNNLVESELLTQAAIRRGLLSRPDVKAQIALAQKAALIQALENDFIKRDQPTDAEIRARYNQLGSTTQYHLSHILVPSEQQASALIARLKAGANFESLARQYSKDGGSAQNGGDLNWGTPDGMRGAGVPEIASAIAPLKKGQFTSAPVHTRFGWHIVKVDDIRTLAPPPFEQVRAQISQQLIQEKWQAFVDRLHKRARVQ